MLGLCGGTLIAYKRQKSGSMCSHLEGICDSLSIPFDSIRFHSIPFDSNSLELIPFDSRSFKFDSFDPMRLG